MIDYCVLMTEFTADGGDGFAMIPQGTKLREPLGGDLGKRTYFLKSFYNFVFRNNARSNQSNESGILRCARKDKNYRGKCVGR